MNVLMEAKLVRSDHCFVVMNIEVAKEVIRGELTKDGITEE